MAAAPSQADASFTTEFSTLVRELRTDVYFCDPQDFQSKGPDSALVRFDGIWDTGATVSVISEKVVQRLRLNPINTTVTQTVNGPRKSGIYLVSMGLPNRIALPAVQVVDGNILGTDALIGMDIICRGDFAITHHSGKTKLTFSMPPSRNVDFVRQGKTRPSSRGNRNRHRTKKSARRKRK
ncbi:MAG: hypothetical protein F4220_15930 [Gammaproteobacteria bacterium]|nr:hypothetical protein [Gammaproteobacteria bacterium]